HNSDPKSQLFLRQPRGFILGLWPMLVYFLILPLCAWVVQVLFQIPQFLQLPQLGWWLFLKTPLDYYQHLFDDSRYLIFWICLTAASAMVFGILNVRMRIRFLLALALSLVLH